MKKILFSLFAFLLVVSCTKKDAPKFSFEEGTWTINRTAKGLNFSEITFNSGEINVVYDYDKDGVTDYQYTLLYEIRKEGKDRYIYREVAGKWREWARMQIHGEFLYLYIYLFGAEREVVLQTK